MANVTKSTGKIMMQDSPKSADASERKWRAEDAHRDIVRAEQKQAELASVKLISNENKK